MSAISEMCSRALLSRTRFAKQEKKSLYLRPPLREKTLHSFPVNALLCLSSTSPTFALQEKTLKNGVLVTSGEQGESESCGWCDLAWGHLASYVCVRVCLYVCLCAIWQILFANGSEWLRVGLGVKAAKGWPQLHTRTHTNLPLWYQISNVSSSPFIYTLLNQRNDSNNHFRCLAVKWEERIKTSPPQPGVK